MVFADFDRIRVINLVYRHDRRAQMEKELASVGLAGDPRVQFFTACTFTEKGLFYSAGAKGVFCSHLAILKQAAGANESVLILEDDCDFSPCAQGYQLPGKWDVFYGGFLATSKPWDPRASDIVGAHFMGFNAQTVQRLVPWLEAALDGEDPAPIDGEYVRFRRANPDLISVFADPQIGVQRSSRTDVGTVRIFDRVPGVRQAADLARKGRRAWRHLRAD